VEERKKRVRERRSGKQDAALEVDGVSCYVLLSTLGRSPTPTASLTLSFSLSFSFPVPQRIVGRRRRRKEYNIKSHGLAPSSRTDNPRFTLRRPCRAQDASFRGPCEESTRKVIRLSIIRILRLPSRPERNPSLPSLSLPSLYPSFFLYPLPPWISILAVVYQRAILRELNLMSSIILFVPLHLFLLLPFCSLPEPEGKRLFHRARKHLDWGGRRQEIPSSTLPNINNYKAIFYINTIKVVDCCSRGDRNQNK